MSGTPPAAADFLSGTSGMVVGKRATTRAVLADAWADAVRLTLLDPRGLRRAAAAAPRRRVLVLAVEHADRPNLLAHASAELARSHHSLTVATSDIGGRGKFQNLNRLLSEHPAGGHDWLLVVDDDVALPRGFLDTFVFLAERFDLRLAQPAHRARSHAAWQVTRRQPGSVVRQTRYVEIGPVVAFHSSTFATLLPYPDLRMGWGLDHHWAAVAAANGWPVGVIDATPIRHGTREIASGYARSDAIEEGVRFLTGRPHLTATEAQQTLATHRRWT